MSRPRLLPSLVPNVQFSPSEIDALLFAAQSQKVALNADAFSAATLKLDALKEVLQNAAPAPIEPPSATLLPAAALV
jgi:hypothetical protein